MGTDSKPLPSLPDISLQGIENLNSANVVDKLSSLQTHILDLGIDWGLKLIAAIIILIIGWVVGNWVDRRFDSMKRLDDTLKNFLGGFFKYTIIFLSLITVIGVFGIPIASLLAVLGAAGLAIGLALQGTLSNVASGVMLLILRPFNVGDYIEFGEFGGTVKTLGLLEQQLLGIDARALCEFYSMGKVVDYFMIDNYYRVLHKEKYYQANEKLIKLLLLPSSPYGGKLVNPK